MTEQLLIQRIPHGITKGFLSWRLGQDFSPQGHTLLRRFAGGVLNGYKLQASQELPPIYRDSPYGFNVLGTEFIPPDGETLVMSTHPHLGTGGAMAQFVELISAFYKGRYLVREEEIREPMLIMQKGLKVGVSLPGGRHLGISPLEALIAQFYTLAARSLSWGLVQIPEFDQNKQIKNEQKFPPSAYKKLKRGGAVILYPQGTHRDPYDLDFPDKANELLEGIYQKIPQTKLVPVRVLPGENRYTTDIHIGRSIGIARFADLTGGLNIRDFVQNHIAPLGR